MNKKIFAIFAVLLVAASMSTVSAFDLGDLFGFGEKQTVTVGGVDFYLPDGYQEDPTNITNEAVSFFQEQGFDVTIKGYMKDSNLVGIFVVNMTDSPINNEYLAKNMGNATKINDVDGFMMYADGAYVFTYVKDKYLVLISSTDENTISDFIIA